MSGLARSLREDGLAATLEALLVWKLLRPWQRRRWVGRCRRDEAAFPLDGSDSTWAWAAPGGVPADWFSPAFPLGRARLDALAGDPALRAGLPVLRERCRQIAQGDFGWLMAGTPNLGPVPDWHALLDTPGRWPDGPSESIDYLGAERPGDIRRCWELNRHQYFLVLGRAWRLERDEEAAACFVRHLEDWIARNPPGHGPHWIQAQEVALRAVSWALAWHLFHDAPAFHSTVRGRMLRSLSHHLRFVEREVCAFGKWTHNHLISELAGLFIVSTMFPQLRGAQRLSRWSRRLLNREAGKQVWPDGLDGELSTAYMGFVLENLALCLAVDRGAWRGSVLESRVAAMGAALARLLRPDGSLPLVGDSDGGRGFLLGEALERRDGIGRLPSLLGHAAPPWTPGADHVPEWRWLFPTNETGAGTEPMTAAGSVFVEGGLWCWRAHGGADSPWLLLRGGATRRRRWVQQSHHHADVLSLEYAPRGRALLVDPGTYAYGLETGLRQDFRGSRAHNTLWVEGHEPCDFRGGRFGVWNLPLSRWIRRPGPKPEAVMAVEYGPVRHERRVAVLEDGLELEDRVERPAERAAELGFQWVPGAVLEPLADGDGWRLPDEGLELRLVLQEGGTCAWRLVEGKVSTRYGQWEPAPRLVLALPAAAVCRVVLRFRVENPPAP